MKNAMKDFKNKKRCVIISGAPITDYEYLKSVDFSESFVICADGGYRHAKNLGVIPNVLLGDNDSYTQDYPDYIESYKYPPEKDKTDTNIALDFALGAGYADITLLGGLGGRIDHEYSHFCLMKYALDRGGKLTLLDGKNKLWMESGGAGEGEKAKFYLERDPAYKYVSFFPYGGDVQGFSVSGLKYTAENMTLSVGEVQASSNEFNPGGLVAEIGFRRGGGDILVILSKD